MQETKPPLTIDSITGEIRTSLPVKQIKMASAKDIQRELASVYRECRRNQLDVQDGARLVYILGELRKACELADIETRIQQLEAMP